MARVARMRPVSYGGGCPPLRPVYRWVWLGERLAGRAGEAGRQRRRSAGRAGGQRAEVEVGGQGSTRLGADGLWLLPVVTRRVADPSRVVRGSAGWLGVL
ncbi:hypothetical protein GCM10029976_069650 [Kribbella albertanoniae]